MGTDIHIFPEILSYDNGKTLDRNPWVVSLGEYRGIARCYLLFGIMAGVRGDTADMIVSPRGLPKNVGCGVQRTYFFCVYADNDAKKYVNNPYAVCETQAENYIKSGLSKVVDAKNTYLTGQGEYSITHPDWHSASHLSTDELFEVRKRYLIAQHECNYEKLNIKKSEANKKLEEIKSTSAKKLFRKNYGLAEFAALNGLIALLYAFEQTDSEKYKGRIVFWFDS